MPNLILLFPPPRYDVRNRFFSRGVNRSSMSMIDTAAFFLVLDDFDHEIDHMEPSTLAVNGKVSAVLQALLVTVTLLPKKCQ